MIRSLYVLVFMWISGVALAADQSYGLNKYYLIDQQAAFTIEEVRGQEFTPYQSDLSLGFQEGAVWLRLDIQPSVLSQHHLVDVTSKTSPMILRLGPYVLDSAVLYESAPQGWVAQSLGDRTGAKDSMCPDGKHCFALSSSPHEAVTVYVKVMQRGIFTVQADVVAWENLPKVVAVGSGRNASAIAVSMSLLLLGLALLLVERTKLLLIFCAFEAVVVLLVAATTGLMASYLNSWSPATLDIITHHLFNLRVAMFVLVCWGVMSNYNPSRLYHRCTLILLILNLSSALLISMGQIKWAIVMFLTVTGLNLMLQAYALLLTGGISTKIRALLGVSYGVYILVFFSALVNLFPEMFPWKPLSSINSFSDWRTNGGPAGLVVFLFVIIHNADRKLADSKALGQFKLQAAQSMANAEKLSERQTLIDMLTHELKNPLGTMRFALASFKRQLASDQETLHRIKRMDMSIDRMNDLIEQVAGSNKIDRFQLTDPLEMIDAAELIQEFISDELSAKQFKLHLTPGIQFHSHRRMLAMIIENLIGNASKYAEPATTIVIDVFEQNKATVFRITNSVEISNLPDPNQLFKRYYRHDSFQALPGLGIGLSLVKTASEKIGAEVGFSIDQHTITFTLKVPL